MEVVLVLVQSQKLDVLVVDAERYVRQLDVDIDVDINEVQQQSIN